MSKRIALLAIAALICALMTFESAAAAVTTTPASDHGWIIPHTSATAVYADNAFTRALLGYSDTNPSVGQSFTTENNVGGYVMTSFTFALGQDCAGFENSAWTIGIFALSGNSIVSKLYEETFTGSVAGNDFVTMPFTTPVTLAATTTYAAAFYGSLGYVDYISPNSGYAGGTAFSLVGTSGGRSITGATGITPKSNANGTDFSFVAEMTAIPEPAALLLLPLLVLGLRLKR